MFACPAHCLLLLVPLQVGTALHSSAISKSIFSRCSGGAGKGLPANSHRFGAGSYKLNKTTRCILFCEANTEPQEDFYLQSAGFKMLGEDSNILDEGRECGVKGE